MAIIDVTDNSEAMPESTDSLADFVESVIQTSLEEYTATYTEELRASIIMAVEKVLTSMEDRLQPLQARLDLLEQKIRDLPRTIAEAIEALPSPHVEVETKVVVPPRTSEKTLYYRDDGLPDKIIDREWSDV